MLKKYIFGGLCGASIIRQTGPILVHINPLIHINCTCQIWKQSKKNLFTSLIQNICFGVKGDVKSKATGCTKMSENADVITVDTYKRRQLTTSSFGSESEKQCTFLAT